MLLVMVKMRRDGDEQTEVWTRRDEGLCVLRRLKHWQGVAMMYGLSQRLGLISLSLNLRYGLSALIMTLARVNVCLYRIQYSICVLMLQ